MWAGVLRWASLYQDLCVNILILGCFVATTIVSDKVRQYDNMINMKHFCAYFICYTFQCNDLKTILYKFFAVACLNRMSHSVLACAKFLHYWIEVQIAYHNKNTSFTCTFLTTWLIEIIILKSCVCVLLYCLRRLRSIMRLYTYIRTDWICL